MQCLGDQEPVDRKRGLHRIVEWSIVVDNATSSQFPSVGNHGREAAQGIRLKANSLPIVNYCRAELICKYVVYNPLKS